MIRRPATSKHRLLYLALLTAFIALVTSGCGLAGQGEGALADEVVADRAGDDEATGTAEVVLETSGVTIPVRPEVVFPSSWPSEVEELLGRYRLYWEAFAAAHALPNADPSFEQLRLLSTEENWRSLQTQLSGFADDGLVLVLPPNSIAEHLLRIPNASVLEKVEGAEVLIQDCWIDDFIQQTVDGRVVAETKEAKLMNASLKFEDGEWRVDGVARATSESDGYEQCEALVS
ncbi:MAG: hypothetical protein ACRBK7_10235 [Acidimicrobiales bacterium]